MRFPSIGLVWFLGLLLVPASLAQNPAGGGGLQISPVQVLLSAKKPAGMLNLRNEKTEAARFELRVFAWEESPDGKSRLIPTGDILVFPAMMTVGPGEERKIRVGSTTPFGTVEKSYRLVIEQLPPPRTEAQAEEGLALRMLTTMSLPIFLLPAKALPKGSVEGLAFDHGRLSIQVKNAGNVHLKVQTISIQGLAASGESVMAGQLTGWYVLPGRMRIWESEIPINDCARIKTLKVEAKTPSESFAGLLEVPPGSCGE